MCKMRVPEQHGDAHKGGKLVDVLNLTDTAKSALTLP